MTYVQVIESEFWLDHIFALAYLQKKYCTL